jgi:hypothetical protein
MFNLSLLREKVLPPPPPFLVPTIFLVSLGGSLLPPGRARALSITAVLSCLLAQFRHPTGDVIQDGLLPIQGLIIFSHWVDFYLLHGPEREFYQVRDVKDVKDGDVKGREAGGKGEGKERENVEGKNEGGRQGLGWHFDLMTSMRGVGWNWRVKNIPSSPSQTKW